MYALNKGKTNDQKIKFMEKQKINDLMPLIYK